MKGIYKLAIFVLLAIFVEQAFSTGGTDSNDEQYFNEFYTALGFQSAVDPCTSLTIVVSCESTRITTIIINSGISGTISPAVAQLTELTSLQLIGPGISGTIPTQLGSLSKLTGLYLMLHPDLVGTLPTELALITGISGLAVAGTSISGTLNPIFGTLTSLVGINFAGNKLTGTIDSSFGNLPALQGLALSDNQFCGTIPATIVQNQEISYMLLLGTNNICPIADYSAHSNTDYEARACDGCSTAYSCCDAGLSCLGGSNQAFTCELPTFDLTIETTEATTGSITITLVGSKASSQHNLGAVFGTVGTQTISSLQVSANIGDLYSIKVTNSDSNNPWTFSTINVSGGYTMSFGKDIKVKNSRVLDGPMSVTLKTKNTQSSGSASTIYITFNGSKVSETRGVAGPFVPGETKQVSFSYLNTHDLQDIVLGSFSIDDWDFDYIEVTFLGITKSFSNTSGRSISKYNSQKSFAPN